MSGYGNSGNAISTNVPDYYSTGVISMSTTLSSSATPSTTSTSSSTEVVAPVFPGAGSFSPRASWIQIFVSFAVASLVLIYL